MSFTAVVPAAGRGERFGGRKLLTNVSGELLLDRTLASLLDAGAESIVGVAAAENELREVRRLQDPRVAIVVNPDPGRGMFSSVQTGLAAVANSAIVLVLPGDMPYVRAETLAVVAAECASAGQVVIPACGGRRGHPVAIPHAACASLLEADSRSTLKAEVQRLGLGQRVIVVDDPAVLRDVDTRADLTP